MHTLFLMENNSKKHHHWPSKVISGIVLTFTFKIIICLFSQRLCKVRATIPSFYKEDHQAVRAPVIPSSYPGVSTFKATVSTRGVCLLHHWENGVHCFFVIVSVAQPNFCWSHALVLVSLLLCGFGTFPKHAQFIASIWQFSFDATQFAVLEDGSCLSFQFTLIGQGSDSKCSVFSGGGIIKEP